MKYTFAILASATVLSLVSCKSESTSEKETKTPPEVVPELEENRLADEPTAFLSFAAESKVNWQPWSPKVLEYAEKSQRMIFVLVGSARYSGCYETLRALDQNPTLVNRINQNYVPVLTDIDINRETGLLAYNLSSESRVPVAFPFLMLLSPDGNPVTWHPIQFSSDREIYDFFDNSLEVVGRLWDDSPAYVNDDSSTKATMRSESLPKADEEIPEIAERQRRYKAAMRKLGSFYDEDVTSMAGSGGLFPFGVFDTLTLAVYDEALPESQRKKYRETLASFTQVLLSSAMVDVLDGGIHPARRGRAWNLVVGRRDCSTQARAGRLFARMHQLEGFPGTLETAINAVKFAEERFQTPNGMFSLSEKPEASKTKDWLWTVKQVSSVLTEEEFKVWKNYSQLAEIGNLPSEADPNRNYFRLNSISAARTPEEVSETTGIDLTQVNALIDSGRKKLRKAREGRIPPPAPDPAPSALSSFRMVSAYASLYAATDDTVWLEKAINLGKASKANFLSNIFLNERQDAEPEGSSDGRAFSYAVAVQAGLDLGAITLEEEWYSWAQDLTTLLAEHFVTEEGRLMEVRKVSQVVDIDYEDRMMIFDDSTAGLLRLNLHRLRALGFKTPPSLTPWIHSAPPFDNYPIIFSDTMLALSHEWNHYRIKIGTDTSEDIANAARTLPLQLVVRRREDKPGTNMILPDDSEISISQPDELKNLFKNK